METRDSKVYDLEIRESDSGPGRVEGRALVYGDRARLADGRTEEFAPGALRRPPDGPIFANVRHDSGRMLAADPGSMTVEFRESDVLVAFELPDTDLGRETAVLARAGVLKGLSVEFRAVKEEARGLVRVIRDAYLFGVGMVPRPAYQLSQAEIRAAAAGCAQLSSRRGWVF